MPKSSAGMPVLVNSLQNPSLSPWWDHATEPLIDIQRHRHKPHHWLGARHPCSPAGYLLTRTNLSGAHHVPSLIAAWWQQRQSLEVPLLPTLHKTLLNWVFFEVGVGFFGFFGGCCFFLNIEWNYKILLRSGFCYGFCFSVFIEIRFYTKVYLVTLLTPENVRSVLLFKTKHLFFFLLLTITVWETLWLIINPKF